MNAKPYQVEIKVTVGCQPCDGVFNAASWLLPQHQRKDELMWVPACDDHAEGWYADTDEQFRMLPAFHHGNGEWRYITTAASDLG